MNTQGRIQSAEEAIDALYLGEERHYIKGDLSDRMINRAIRKSKRLYGNAYEVLEAEALLAQEKHQAVQKLQKIYQPIDHDAISDTTQKSIPFREEVTKEAIHENYHLTDWLVEDEGTKRIDQLMAGAKSDLNVINSMQAGMAFLAPQYSISRENVPNIIRTISNISQQNERVSHHPQASSIIAELVDFLDEFIVALEVSHQAQAYPEELIYQLVDSEHALALIADTILDVRPKVSLTFDDGPNEEFTPQVLDILKEHDIQATFFVVGRYVELHPEIAQRIVAEGHIIANHSYDHPDLATISDSEVLDQIHRTQTIIDATTGVTPTLYRMPYGSGGERVYRLFPELTSVTWNTDTGDWYLRDAEAIYQNIMTQLSDDMLVLLHDTNQDSVDVLKKLVASFKEGHYNFVAPLDLDFDFRY